MRANVFGTLSLERIFSCVRRVCHNNSHILQMMQILRFARLMTTIRTRLGLSPDIEEPRDRSMEMGSFSLCQPDMRRSPWAASCLSF